METKGRSGRGGGLRGASARGCGERDAARTRRDQVRPSRIESEASPSEPTRVSLPPDFVALGQGADPSAQQIVGTSRWEPRPVVQHSMNSAATVVLLHGQGETSTDGGGSPIPSTPAAEAGRRGWLGQAMARLRAHLSRRLGLPARRRRPGVGS